MKKFLQSIITCLLLLPAFAAQAATASIIEDGFVGGWASWSWPASPVPVSPATSPTFKGSGSIRMDFTAPWAGFSPGGNNGPFDATGYKSLVFAVYNASNAGQLYLRINAYDPAIASTYVQDYTSTNSIPQGQWTWVRIPLADLSLPANKIINFISIQSATVGTAYFDEMRFERNITFFEGVKTQVAPSIQVWYWGSGVSSPIGGRLDVNVTNTWGGVQLNLVNKFTGRQPVSDYGILAVKFTKTVTNQSLIASLAADGVSGTYGSVNLENYVPGGVAAINTEYEVFIPLSAFGAGSQSTSGVVFVSNVPGWFLLDDVRFLEAFKLPLPGGKDWYETVQPGGAAFCGTAADTLHAIDAAYYSIDFAARTYQDAVGNTILNNVPILAAASGRVVTSGFTSSNGNHVVIDHDFDGDINTGLTTWYLHLVSPSSLAVGDTVRRGQQLGIMGNTGLSDGVHLHFQFKHNGQRTRDGAPALRNIQIENRLIENYTVGCRTNSPPTGFYPSTNY